MLTSCAPEIAPNPQLASSSAFPDFLQIWQWSKKDDRSGKRALKKLETWMDGAQTWLHKLNWSATGRELGRHGHRNPPHAAPASRPRVTHQSVPHLGRLPQGVGHSITPYANQLAAARGEIASSANQLAAARGEIFRVQQVLEGRSLEHLLSGLATPANSLTTSHPYPSAAGTLPHLALGHVSFNFPADAHHQDACGAASSMGLPPSTLANPLDR